MYAWLETHPIAYSDSDILSISWKGSIPSSERDKPHIRKRNCVTGWLAVGTRKCVVGVTFTTIHTKDYLCPNRTNFNLRGHNAEVVLVRWNEPFQKMATCDANGVIFVWIRFECRWSIELVNDRQHQVTDFAWSHDGRMALIAYRDGFVLVGSVQGQRYWSSQLNIDGIITCGAWTTDDKIVLFGTNNGQIVAMDIHGAVLAQIGLTDNQPINYMCYNCEKFRMTTITETPDGERCSRDSKRARRKRNMTVAMQIGTREINFMRSYDDLAGNVSDTFMTDLKMEWSNCGMFLAVAGWCVHDKSPKIKFYSVNGLVKFTLNVPSKRPVSAITWAHNDKRVFIASGAGVFVVYCEKQLSSLQMLARNAIVHTLRDDGDVDKLQLSNSLTQYISDAMQPTIKTCFPKNVDMKKFVSTPPPDDARYYCTMIVYEQERRRSPNAQYGGPYVLYLEYLGGLVPLLRGDKISKVRPEFVVYNPASSHAAANPALNTSSDNCSARPRPRSGQLNSSGDNLYHRTSSGGGGGLMDDDSYSDRDDGSPLSGTEADRDESVTNNRQRKKRKKRKGQYRNRVEKVSTRPFDIPFPDKLPDDDPLMEVLANLWGTKFRLHGLGGTDLPTDVGYVSYKTSVLHLQPRQMTIAIPLLDESSRAAAAAAAASGATSLIGGMAAAALPTSVNTTAVFPGGSGCSSVANVGANGLPAAANCAAYSANVAMMPQFASTPPQQLMPGGGSSNHDSMYASDEDNMERKVIQAAYSVNSNQPLEVAAAVASVFTSRDEAMISPVQRCPRHPYYHLNGPPSGNVNRNPGASLSSQLNRSAYISGPGGGGSSGSTPAGVRPVRPATPFASSFAHESPCEVAGGGSSVLPLNSSSVSSPSTGSPSAPQPLFDYHMVSVRPKTISSRHTLAPPKHRAHSSTPLRPTGSNKINFILSDEDSDNSGCESAMRKCRHDVSFNSQNDPEESFSALGDSTEHHANQPLFAHQHSNSLSHQAPVYQRTRSCPPPGDDVAPPSCSSFRASTSAAVPLIRSPMRQLSCREEAVSRKAASDQKNRLSVGFHPSGQIIASQPGSGSGVVPNRKSSPCLVRHGFPCNNKNADSSPESEMFLSAEEAGAVNPEMRRRQLRKFRKLPRKPENLPKSSDSKVDEFVMLNKSPIWNESTQVYQLDFGGRVTQESAKNFQIEHGKDQVLQFGRIDENAYTLDFQSPFSAIQAFGIALANVTQRLK